VQSLKVTVDIEDSPPTVIREPSQDIICDFVDGYAFGVALGVGLRTTSSWWSVMKVELGSDYSSVSEPFLVQSQFDNVLVVL
jgi:hypothetical protein